MNIIWTIKCKVCKTFFFYTLIVVLSCQGPWPICFWKWVREPCLVLSQIIRRKTLILRFVSFPYFFFLKLFVTQRLAQAISQQVKQNQHHHKNNPNFHHCHHHHPHHYNYHRDQSFLPYYNLDKAPRLSISRYCYLDLVI